MKHNVKTSFGVFKLFYNTNPGNTQHSRKIQGKAIVVGEWTLVTNSLLVPYETKMSEAGNYFTMISADYGITMEPMVDMFVDNANHIVGCEYDKFFPSRTTSP